MSCSQCGKALFVCLVHSVVKLFVCSQCGKALFVCSQCGKALFVCLVHSVVKLSLYVHSVVKLSLLIAIFILSGVDALSCLLVVESVKTC